MKKTFMLKTFLLMMIFTFSHTVPSFASATVLGNIDTFNATQISGWVYDSVDTSSSEEISLKVTDVATGETVQEVTAVPSFQHGDLSGQVGSDINTGFTAAIDLSGGLDGTYSAAAYKDGTKVSSDVYYSKGTAANTEGMSYRSLGTFRLTAYCPCRSCSEGWGRSTSSGAVAASNHTIAVDRNVIPMGSRLLINGVVYTAEDVGGGVKGKHVDIFFDNHAQTKQFGSQSAEVFLLN